MVSKSRSDESVLEPPCDGAWVGLGAFVFGESFGDVFGARAVPRKDIDFGAEAVELGAFPWRNPDARNLTLKGDAYCTIRCY